MIAAVRPRVFVMENVPGLENLANGLLRRQIIEDLTLDGEYKVSSRVVDAAAFGVPQNRLRVLFIGVRADLDIEPRFPHNSRFPELPGLLRAPSGGTRYLCTYRHVPSILDTAALTELLDPESTQLVTVEQAISDLAHLRPSATLIRRPSDEPIAYETEPQSAYQRARRRRSHELFNADVPSIREDTVARLRAIPPGGNFRDMPPRLTARYLNGKKWGPELGRAELSRKYFFAYRKLHPKHFSWTLNTKADCVFHYSKPRALTVREFARLHSFDDSYRFLVGDRHSRYRQVGNAVPPLFAKAIAETVHSILEEHELAQQSSALAVAAE
jgi:DNA (cytosine-5)-methyltransferase 1